MAWLIVPWCIQYIVAACIAIIISVYVFLKNPRPLATRYFFAFGMFTTIWLSLIFLHRTAPTDILSGYFFRTAMFFSIPLPALLLLTVAFLRKEKRVYNLWLLPAFIVAATEIMIGPSQLVWTTWGWSYKYPPLLMPLIIISFLSYGVAVIVSAWFFGKRVKLLRKKYYIISFSYFIYIILMSSSNYLLAAYPELPPFGGILTLGVFIFIAYAISLPTEKITIPPGKPLEILADDWLKFLRKVREVVPGRELGEDVARFDDALKSMWLSDVVRYEKGGLIFNAEQLAPLGINEIVWETTDFMRKTDWALPAIKEYTNVFVNIYKTVSKTDKKAADSWLNTMIRKYGGFLDKQGVLDAMPEEVKIPEIFKELRARRMCLFKEEKPTKAYEKLKEVLEHGFECLVISKLEPKKVEERYDVGDASIFWLTFKEVERAINPKDFDKFKRTISEFVKKPSKSIVLLDCFDEIILANGFEKAEGLLREVKDICGKNNANLLLSINPEMFEEKQIATIEKQLSGVK